MVNTNCGDCSFSFFAGPGSELLVGEELGHANWNSGSPKVARLEGGFADPLVVYVSFVGGGRTTNSSGYP